MEDMNEYDTLFMEIAGRSGGLDKLLDNFFGFLHRRTDFYVTLDKTDDNAKMGFPEGVAEQMVLRTMNKYNFKKYALEKQKYEQQSPSSSSSSSSSSSKLSPSSSSSSSSSSSNSTVIDINPQSAPSSSSSLAVRYSEEGKQIPIGNGGIGPNYYWTQTLQDLTVYVDVPVGCRGRDIKCFIEAKKLFLSADGQVMIDGFFEEAIKVDESMWTLNIAANSIPQVVITLDKGRKTWWKHIIQGHPEIDTSKVDSSQKIDEYDDSTQAAIRKIMFDQKQKALGLPTSEDIEKEDLIQKAMSMPGCPFIQTDEVGSPVMPPGISSPWDVEKGKKKG
jgi:hypothetical protein